MTGNFGGDPGLPDQIPIMDRTTQGGYISPTPISPSPSFSTARRTFPGPRPAPVAGKEDLALVEGKGIDDDGASSLVVPVG